MKRASKRVVAFFTATFFVFAAAAGDVGNVNADIFGVWKIVAVLDSADLSGMSDRKARSMVGKPVRIESDRFQFDATTCKSPTYKRTVEDAAKHLREKGHVSSVNLRLPNPVTVVDAKCTFIYLKRDGRIVVQWDGVYFDAVKQGVSR